jgi:hypothetical protein
MWSEGTISSPTTGRKYKYWVKHYEEPSADFGIGGGRIFKLTIRKLGESRDLYNYDRGLDVDCADDEVRAVYEIILAKYN